jgi:hypothetical protein
MDLQEIGWGGMDYIDPVNQWWALVNMAMNFWVP